MFVIANSSKHRLHFWAATEQGSFREIESKSRETDKCGIAIKKWWQINWGKKKFTKIIIGNKTYNVNKCSLKQYLVRTSGIDQKVLKQASIASIKAFNLLVKSNTHFQNCRTSQASKLGLMLLRHAQVVNLRQTNNKVRLPIPSIQSLASKTQKTFDDLSLWTEFYTAEIDIFKATFEDQKAMNRAKERLTQLQRFTRAFNLSLDASSNNPLGLLTVTNQRFDVSKREEILQVAEQMSTRQLEQLTLKLEQSAELTTELAALMDLHRQLEKLEAQERRLKTSLLSFKDKFERQDQNYRLFTSLIQCLDKNSKMQNSIEEAEPISKDVLDTMALIDQNLAQKINEYNRCLTQLQEKDTKSQRQINDFDAEVISQSDNYVKYYQLLHEFNQQYEGPSAQIQREGITEEEYINQFAKLGVRTIEIEVSHVDEQLERIDRYIDDPNTNILIESQRFEIEEIKGQVKVLKTHKKNSSQLREEIARLRGAIAEQTKAYEQQVAEGNAQSVIAKQLKEQIASYKENLTIFESVDNPAKKAILLREKELLLAGMEKVMDGLKHQKEQEVNQYSIEKTMLKKVRRSLLEILKPKRKSLESYIKEIEKTEKVRFKRDGLLEVKRFLQTARDNAKFERSKVIARAEIIRREKAAALELFIDRSTKLRDNLMNQMPGRLALEVREQLTKEHFLVSREISHLKAKIHLEFNQNLELQRKAKQAQFDLADFKAIYKQAAGALELNLGFLYTLVDFPKIPPTELGSFLAMRREQSMRKAQAVITSDRSKSITADLSNPLIFEAAKSVLYRDFPSKLSSAQRCQSLERRMGEYARDTLSRNRPLLFVNCSLYSNADSSELTNLSLINDSVSRSSEMATDLNHPRTRDEVIGIVNPLYFQLLAGTDQREEIKELVSALEDFELKYFGAKNSPILLDINLQKPFVCQETFLLLNTFIGGEKITNVEFDYTMMAQMITENGCFWAEKIRQKPNEISAGDYAVRLCYDLLLASLAPSCSKTQLDVIFEMMPNYRDILTRQGKITSPSH